MITRKQLKKLKNLVEYAYENSTFYREHYKVNNFHPSMLETVDDYRKIPIVRRDQLKKISSEEILTTSNRGNLLSQTTSGSSGINIRIFYSKIEKCINLWTCLKSYFINKQSLFDVTVALRDPVDIKKTNILQKFGILRYDYFNVFDPIEDNYKKIVSKYKHIKILKGMPSDLAALSLCAKKHGNFPSVGVIFSDSEVLDDANKTFIEKVLKARVINYYATVECGMIAYQNISNDNNYFNINNNYMIVFPKENKEIDKAIVTNLYNFTYPIINYEIGDVLEFDNIGGTDIIIKTVFGKYLDFIILPDKSVVSPHVVKQMLTHIKGISRFQVQQIRIDEIKIVIEKGKDYSKYTQQKIISEVNSFSKGMCKVTIDFTDQFQKVDYRKFKVIESKIAQNFLESYTLPKVG